MKFKKHGTYLCENPKGEWKADTYTIDFQDAKQRKMAIWNNGAWAINNLPSAKQALEILNKEFSSVKKLEL